MENTKRKNAQIRSPEQAVGRTPETKHKTKNKKEEQNINAFCLSSAKKYQSQGNDIAFVKRGIKSVGETVERNTVQFYLE
jgi:hypothetical protein